MVVLMVSDLENLIVAITGFIAILTSVMVIKSRNLVYAAVYLSIVGVINSILIALLGYIIIAVLHILIYVGAGIMFIVMSISMMRETSDATEFRLPAALLAVLVAIPIAYVGINMEPPGKAVWNPNDYIELSTYIVSNYPLPILIVLLALASVLIASISITRGSSLEEGDVR